MTELLSISKSQYIKGLQCQKQLWLYRNNKEIVGKVDLATQLVIDQGNEVGEIAKSYYKGGVEVEADYWDLDGALNETKRLVSEDYKVIYEACAASEDGLYSKIDILVRVENSIDTWDLIEVKGSTEVKEYHIDDMASQRHAFIGGGYNIRKSILMLINTNYVRDGALDVKQLFTQNDCTEAVVDRMKEVERELPNLLKVLAESDEPQVETGAHCTSPHDCPYREYCGAISPKEPVEGEVTYDRDGLLGFVETLKYPLYFFDYETVNPAIPYFDKTGPYKHYPFQYSLHIQKEKGAELEHVEFLHEESSDPRAVLAKRLVNDLGKKGSVVVFYASFEVGVNKKLAELFPEYKEDIDAINARVVDLIIPFRKKWLRHPEQRGSNSIKAVLPSFCPDLSYEDLDIQNGLVASGIFRGVLSGALVGVEKEKVLSDLREYCGLDTLAMVRLLEVIYSYVE